MIFGRKLPMLAETGDSQRTLTILEKGGFGPEKYNESYQSFVEKNHRHKGLDIIKTAHEKFPNDPVSCSENQKTDTWQYKPLWNNYIMSSIYLSHIKSRANNLIVLV